ncbi:MAG: 4-hydroxybenzoate polyprenyltransferase [Lentimonas sp.]|jgi:4-hydroxybenzoate polyprenyltransferase
MKIIKHRFYRSEIISDILMTVMFIALGLILLDGGVVVTIALLASLAFWLGAIPALRRRKRRKSDQLYLKYGLFIIILLTILIAPIIWNHRLNH